MDYLLWALPGKIFTLFIGLYFFRKLPTCYKLIFVQVFFALLAESFGAYLGHHYIHNAWVFNIYNLIDLLLTGIAAQLLLRKYKYIIYGFIVFGFIIWGIEVYKYGILHLANIFFIFSCILLVCVYLFVLLNQSLFTKRIFTEPAFWLSISVILYFGCCLPYFGLYNYLINEQYAIAKKLVIINRVFNFIRYPFIAVCFIIIGRQKGKAPKTV